MEIAISYTDQKFERFVEYFQLLTALTEFKEKVFFLGESARVAAKGGKISTNIVDIILYKSNSKEDKSDKFMQDIFKKTFAVYLKKYIKFHYLGYIIRLFRNIEAVEEIYPFTRDRVMTSLYTLKIYGFQEDAMQDLENGIIRLCWNTKKSKKNPGWMLEAVYQARRHNCEIQEDNLSMIYREGYRLDLLPRETLRLYLEKMLRLPQPSAGILLLQRTGLLRHIVPELEEGRECQQNEYHDCDVFTHILKVTDKTAEMNCDMSVRLAALFHDIGKPRCRTEEKNRIHFIGHETKSEIMCREIMSRLLYSFEYKKNVMFLVRHHMDTKQWGEGNITKRDSSIRKMVDTYGKYREECLQLIHADNCSHAPEHCMPRQVDEIRERIGQLGLTCHFRGIPLPFTGEEIKERYGIEGAQMKEVMEIIKIFAFNYPESEWEENKEKLISKIESFLKTVKPKERETDGIGERKK
jgi:putative nucleotidyltransferase with HDIG domain